MYGPPGLAGIGPPVVPSEKKSCGPRRLRFAGRREVIGLAPMRNASSRFCHAIRWSRRLDVDLRPSPNARLPRSGDHREGLKSQRGFCAWPITEKVNPSPPRRPSPDTRRRPSSPPRPAFGCKGARDRLPVCRGAVVLEGPGGCRVRRDRTDCLLPPSFCR